VGELLLASQRVFQIRADAPELRLPCDERIRLLGVQHVTHSKGEGVQAVLNAQQQQRIGTVSVNGLALQFPQTAQLQDRVAGIHSHGRQGHGEASQKPQRRGRSVHRPILQIVRRTREQSQ
jgi:hypothetical protein